MTLQEMKERKRELGLSNEQISAMSGVPMGTVQKIFGGITLAPRRSTIKKLETLLNPAGSDQSSESSDNSSLSRKIDAGRYSMAYDTVTESPGPAVLRESSPAYGRIVPHRQKTYTIDDYMAMPEDYRTELIDGVFYDMATPATVHQEILFSLGLIFRNYVRSHQGSCRVILAPFAVRLDKDDKTMLEPDLVIICDHNKIRKRYCMGAPDLVVEILSPSTRRKDMTLKLMKYAQAGVREYWIVDPDRQQVAVYLFEQDALPSVYTFSDQIPVSIWEAQCVVDFREICQELAYLKDVED